jgi:glucose-6-phosphate dehydrogenase assembly protein OpcA
MHHPSRCIIICRDKESEELRIDAWIKSFDYEVISSTLVECECICLVVGRPTGEHLPSLIQPLMLSDVKTYLWWMGTPVWRSGSLSDALDACDGLVVDSAVFERPFDSFLELADLAVDRGGRESIADLHWTRLHQWREVLAQFFSPPDRRGFLKGINAVGIDYVGEARANRSAAALLAGWLASKLGWELKHAVGGKGGVVVAYMDSGHGHRVEIAFRSVPLAGLSEGEVSAVRFHAVSQGRTCAFSCERQPGAADHTSGGVTMKMQIGSEALTERLPMPVQGEVELLEHLLTGSGRDPVYLGALHEAASLLRAF